MNLLLIYLFFLVYVCVVMLRSDEEFSLRDVLASWAACCIFITVAAGFVSLLVMAVLIPLVMLLERLQ